VNRPYVYVSEMDIGQQGWLPVRQKSIRDRNLGVFCAGSARAGEPLPEAI